MQSTDPKALNLYLVRHGETEGNVDVKRYLEVADHAISLTEKGMDQAQKAGAFLAKRLRAEYEADPEGFGSVRVWHSPYYRTRQTAGQIIYELGQKFDPESGLVAYREEPFLTEQKAGLSDGLTDEQFDELYPEESKNYNRHKDHFGRIYGAAPLGESRMDVVIRVKHHFRNVVDDFTRRKIRHAVIVCHGLTARAYEMGWMRYPPEWLDAEKNPGNCWTRHIFGNRDLGYCDAGYVYGQDAPLGDPMATQILTKNAENVVMLKPQRANTIVPPGINVIDPFKRRPTL